MNKTTAVEALKSRIKTVWNETRSSIRSNISRGHSRSISTDVEDSVAIFISDILDDKIEIFIDSSIRVDKIHRPDILIVKDNKVIALIELKAQMGWCRKANKVIDDEILRMHTIFSEAQNLNCKFSNKDMRKVEYDENVRLFLISLTASNVIEEKIKENIKYAKSKGISHFLLFDGWYYELKDRDIDKFADELQKLI